MGNRRMGRSIPVVQAGLVGEPAGMVLRGKTLGIVGLGRVGQCLAAAAVGLGMQVGTAGGLVWRASRLATDLLLRGGQEV